LGENGSIEVKPMLEDLIRKAHHLDTEMTGLAEKLARNNFWTSGQMKKGPFGSGTVCVPKGEARGILLDEAHNLAYSIHPGTTKMYLDLKTRY
jgi:hypothetical protein